MGINFYSSDEDYKKFIKENTRFISRCLSIVFIMYLIYQVISSTIKFDGVFFKSVGFFMVLGMCVVAYIILKFFLFIILKISNEILLKRNLSRLFRKNPIVLGNKTIEVKDKELVIATDDNFEKYNYSRLTIITIYKDIVVLTYNRKVLCVIPDKVFKSENQRIQFITIIRTKKKSLS